jgi:adenine-specific DNA-methyltransferase
MDLWHYFVHLALATLLQDGGQLSFITNSYWRGGGGARKLIDHIRSAGWIEEIFDLGERSVFPGVRGRHMMFRIRKGGPAHAVRIKCGSPHDAASAGQLVRGEAPTIVFEKSPEQLFHGPGLDLLPPADAWLAKLAAHPPLGALGIVRQGIAENPAAVNARTNRRFGGRWRVGEGVFSLTAEEARRLDLTPEEQTLLRPYHDLCDLGRCHLANVPSRTLIYSTRQTCPDIERHPHLAAHLGRFRAIMAERRETRLGKVAWWQLHWPRDEAVWRAAKIVALQMAARPSFAAAERPVYVPFSANVFVPRPDVGEGLHYLTALLNSRTLWAWFCRHAKRRGVGLEINGHVLARCPIRRIDFASAADRARHDRLVQLAREMAALAANEEHRQRKTELDAEIDAIVFDLYETSQSELTAKDDMA